MILAIDVGDKRVGTAITDDKGMLALPFKTFPRAKYLAENKILRLIKDMAITKIVVGIPLDEKGAETDQSTKSRAFAGRLSKRTNCPVVFVDEYATSSEAVERLNLGGRKLTKAGRKKGMIDAMSAAIILQDFLNYEKTVL